VTTAVTINQGRRALNVAACFCLNRISEKSPGQRAGAKKHWDTCNDDNTPRPFGRQTPSY
jgi:hypothetical protein